MRQKFEAFIDDLRSTHRNNLASVILYGSAAADDFVAKQSDYNILVALHKIGPKDLSSAQPCIREWTRMGHPVPVYFTVSELQNAADVFPIEFLGMETARKVLYGADVLGDLEFSDENLRHQTEYELRSKLIQLRRQFIPASSSIDGLTTLMADSLSSFSTLFGAVLTLSGLNSPSTKREIIELTTRHLKIDGTPFEKIFDIRENKLTEKLDEVGTTRLFGEYMEQIEKVIDAVDAMDK